SQIANSECLCGAIRSFDRSAQNLHGAAPAIRCHQRRLTPGDSCSCDQGIDEPRTLLTEELEQIFALDTVQVSSRQGTERIVAVQDDSGAVNQDSLECCGNQCAEPVGFPISPQISSGRAAAKPQNDPGPGGDGYREVSCIAGSEWVVGK